MTASSSGSERREGFRIRLVGLFAGIVIFTILLAACDGEDRPGGVEVIDDGSASVSGSVSGVGTGGTGGPSGGLGAYVPASNVEDHAMISLDIADINALLGASPIDWDAVEHLYVSGEHSKSGSGNRTLAGFARSEGRSEVIWDDYTAYYGDPVWLDTFVMSAIEGTGAFEGASDAVRRQGAQKGIQNQIVVAWMIHELVAAVDKANDGNFDPAGGAPHNWDEGWAFYHGADPVNSAFSTADKRGGNFGTGTAVNEAILASMTSGLDALVSGDAAGAQAAMDEVVKQLRITYAQATIRYGSLVASDLEAGDQVKAREHQAEGWAFFRVIEPMVAAVDADAAKAIAAAYDIGASLDASAGVVIETEMTKVYPAWGISADEIGSL